jgi:endonuclease YncB( thermonuclease family)
MQRRSAVRGRACILFVLSLLVPALADGQPPRTLTATVVKIVDGDTIHVRIGDRIEKVRYIGMNAPELHHPTKDVEPLGREAAEANRKLVEGQRVRLELDVQERDKYGRLLAYVYVGNMMGTRDWSLRATPPRMAGLSPPDATGWPAYERRRAAVAGSKH